MPYAYTLIVMIVITFIISGLFVITYLLLSEKKKQTRKDIIISYLYESHKNLGEKDRSLEYFEYTPEEFADKYLKGEVKLSEYPTLDAFQMDAIERISGKKRMVDVERVAFVFCKGGNRARDAFRYNGVDNCALQKSLYDGCKMCKSGCLGCMDCAKVCPTHAIFKNKYGVAEVNRKKCIACGQCVQKCPNDVIGLIPLSQEVAIICNVNSEKLKGTVSNICKVGCTGCNKCIEACKYDAIRYNNGYVEIDESKCVKCKKCVYACPNKTISRLNIDL